jgi:Tfp pilus assembly protein PilX
MAMVITVIVMFVIVTLITIIFEEGIQALPLARQAQNYQAALQAAESGVQDYINRLDNNTAYYLTQYDSANTAMENDTSGTPTWTTWEAVSGTNVSEWYRYAVNSTNTAKTGIVNLIVSGAAGQNPTTTKNYTVRTIKEGISLTGFTSFLYFTDYEIDDPAIVQGWTNPKVNGTTVTYTQDCLYHAWQYNPYSKGYGPDDPTNCGDYAISFVSEDTLNGPIFSNDEFHICGAASFPQGATSAYDQGTSASVAGSTSYGNAGAYDSTCAGTPTFGGTGTQPAGGSDEPFPATNTNMENDLASTNDGGGCAYAGPVGIVFNSNGTMAVTLPTGSAYMSSVLSSSWSTSACGTNGATATVNLPPNGLIYDENPSGCATSSCDANAYVSGSVDGQVTVGSQNNITIANNLTDADNMTGTDMIGLSATNYILLPDSNTDQLGSTTKTLPVVCNLTIDAAMVALDHSMWLPGWGTDNSGCAGISTLGTLNLNGSIAQEFRGPVGAHSGATLEDGYGKDYTYDSRLKFQQPPYFTSPTLPNWIESKFTECNATSTPTATTC